MITARHKTLGVVTITQVPRGTLHLSQPLHRVDREIGVAVMHCMSRKLRTIRSRNMAILPNCVYNGVAITTR